MSSTTLISQRPLCRKGANINPNYSGKIFTDSFEEYLNRDAHQLNTVRCFCWTLLTEFYERRRSTIWSCSWCKWGVTTTVNSFKEQPDENHGKCHSYVFASLKTAWSREKLCWITHATSLKRQMDLHSDEKKLQCQAVSCYIIWHAEAIRGRTKLSLFQNFR